MKKVIVIGQSFNRITGTTWGGGVRNEEINLETNILFQHCKTILDIKATYERFWNDINPNSENVVFVQQIMVME